MLATSIGRKIRNPVAAASPTPSAIDSAICNSDIASESVTLAIVIGRELCVPLELPSEGTGILVTHLVENLLDGQAARLQQQLRAIDAQPLNERLNGFAGFLLEAPAEVAAARRHLAQQLLHRKSRAQVAPDP